MLLKLKLKSLAKTCFEGDLTMPKTFLWLTCITCMLAGIVYGLCAAPLTHGIAICSNNGNNSECTWNNGKKEEEDDEK